MEARLSRVLSGWLWMPCRLKSTAEAQRAPCRGDRAETPEPTYMQAQIHLSNPLGNETDEDQILHCRYGLKHQLWSSPEPEKTSLGLFNWVKVTCAQGSHLSEPEYVWNLQGWVSILLLCSKTARDILWQYKVATKVIQPQIWLENFQG